MPQSNGPQASSSQSQILLAEDLRKSYGPRPALRGLSFSLKSGRILGFLSLNRAGKTSAIHSATTMTRPSKLIQKMSLVFTVTALVTALSSCAYVWPQNADVSPEKTDVPPQDATAYPQDWQEEFNLADRKLTDTGESQYFILSPGFQTTLQSPNAKLTITVLDETKEIIGITTRVVEEKEELNGELYEVSRNFYAIDPETGDVFYFGEEVDFYAKGEIIDHSGAWMASETGNKPGLIMSGTPVVGMKYYQELAPGAAMDRAEVLSISTAFTTPAGEFENCLITEESSKIETVIERKTYAPGIGLVQDQAMKLVSYGFIEGTNPQEQ